ncbi:MAG TPA: hypothetical protein VGI75_00985 [Pirellulales bacterium]
MIVQLRHGAIQVIDQPNFGNRTGCKSRFRQSARSLAEGDVVVVDSRKVLQDGDPLVDPILLPALPKGSSEGAIEQIGAKNTAAPREYQKAWESYTRNRSKHGDKGDGKAKGQE